MKPANVWLEGDRRRVKLLDFGLARVAEPDPNHSTVAGAGTPAYMAPEQARGEAVDPRADLWSLGVVLYEMATGGRPFWGNSVFAIMHAVLNHAPPPPRRANPDVPAALDTLIMRLLAKDPAGRPGSSAEVVADLRQIAAALRAPPPPPVVATPAPSGPSAAGQSRPTPVSSRHSARRVVGG